MYIKLIKIKNFRKILNLDIHTQKGVNVIIGDNNSGKSAVIDALRICTKRYDEYDRIDIRKTDFFVDKETGEPNREILLSFIFEIESDEEISSFREMLNITSHNLQVNFQFKLIQKNGEDRVITKIWGGDETEEERRIPEEVLLLLQSVYLGALRDAEKTLEGRKYSKISQLMNKLESNHGNQDRIVDEVHNSLTTNAHWKGLVEKGNNVINTNLSNFSFKNAEELKIELALLPFEFSSLTSQLHPQIPQFKSGSIQKYFEISQNGLGDNNLIYIASVLGDFAANTDSYRAFLIEEPEAHLHPQLQNLLFEYFSKYTEKDFQVFITSHSPTITAKTNLDNIIVLHDLGTTASAINIKDLDLTENDKKYLNRFLDVTKSQLFFSKGNVFVEGMSEAILIPILARKILAGKNLVKYGIEVINVGGISFQSFGKLFNNPELSLKSKAAILTDNDKWKEAVSDSIRTRVENTQALEGGNLIVRFAENTFEYALFIENTVLLEKIYLSMHPQSILQGETLEEKGKDLLKKLENNHDKADFAQNIATALEDTSLLEKFQVPSYIQEGIIHVTQSEHDQQS